MNDFSLFKRRELSYILNNEKIFGKQMVQRIEEYCKDDRFFSRNIRNEYAEWDETSLLDFERCDSRILIKIKKEVYKTNAFIDLIMIILISMFLIVLFNRIFNAKVYDFNFYSFLISIPILLYGLIVLTIRRETTKIKSIQNSFVEILIDSPVRLLVDDLLLIADIVISVDIFWEVVESEGQPTTEATLELATENGKKIVVFCGRNYKELFRIGNEICKFLEIDIRLFNGKSPKVDKIEL